MQHQGGEREMMKDGTGLSEFEASLLQNDEEVLERENDVEMEDPDDITVETDNFEKKKKDEGSKKPAANGNGESCNAPKEGQAVDGDQESRKKEELITVLREAELNEATRKTVRQLEKKTLMLQQELLKKNKQVDALKAKLQDLEGDKEFVQREIAANSYSQKTYGRRVHPADIKKHDKASYLQGDLYTCKCPTPCRFFIPDTPKFKPGCFTTSPTQFNRMHVILGLNPDMRSDPDALQLLAMSPLPLKEKPPTDAVWRAMSHCATLKLVAEDVPGWGISYQNLYGRLVNSCLSAKLMQKETVVIQLCPGVKSSQVPLSNTTIRKWDDDKEGEDTSMDSCSLALVVVPFRTDEHEVEEWQAEVDQWPSDVKNLVLVTAPGAIKDFAKVPVVAQQMKEVKRKSGNLIRITPDELVPSQQNKSLALVGDTRSYETYWKTVKAMLETLGIPWTSFELEKEKRAADTEKDRKSESSTSDKGGQGSHHSVAKKRRFH